MEMNFCRRCDLALTNVENHVYKCANDHIIFANCSPTVGVFFITPDNKILLSVRGIEPHKGMLDSFGGFVDGEESLEEAVARELTEELNLQPGDYTPPQYLTSAIGHYPYKDEVLPILSTFFWSRLTIETSLIPQDDVAKIFVTDLHEVDYSHLHDQDIVAGVKALQALFQ
jgi:ADP-ribose pyrophosphatase YjhB (NUDIX family)